MLPKILLLVLFLRLISPAVISSDATCGEFVNFTCEGSVFGNCCSNAYWCGKSSLYCRNVRCKPGFGWCGSTSEDCSQSFAGCNYNSEFYCSQDPKFKNYIACDTCNSFSVLNSSFGCSPCWNSSDIRCVSWNSDCSELNGTNSCNKCQLPYVLNENGVCTKCAVPDNCVDWDSCSSLTNTFSCQKCIDGSYSQDGICHECQNQTNCLINDLYSCSNSQHSFDCLVCNDGYYLNSNNSCSKCAEIPYCSEVSCTQKSNQCRSCLPGYTLSSPNSCRYNCSVMFTDCMYPQSNPIQCSNDTNYSSYFQCSECFSGFQLNSSLGCSLLSSSYPNLLYFNEYITCIIFLFIIFF